MDKVLQFLFVLDIFLTFFTPYYHRKKLIVEYKAIAMNYVFSPWLVLDLLTVFPYDLFVDHTDEN